MENLIYTYCPLRQYNFNGGTTYVDISTYKLISTRDDTTLVQPMWRMEMLAKFYGINILDYGAPKDCEAHMETVWVCNTDENRKVFNCGYEARDKYDQYFEQLAYIAVEVGCERAEIKCLIKSLILKYRHVEYLIEFPHTTFEALYNRLIESKDAEQLRVAERLSRYHAKRYREFLQLDIGNKFK